MLNMLQNLYVKNLALIDETEVEFGEGLNILTGETGAGKPQYVPITSIGREWYNTHGSVDIILDKSQRVDFFYHNTKENEFPKDMLHWHKDSVLKILFFLHTDR